MVNAETVLTLRQVSKDIMSGINALNSFNRFLAKQEFGSSDKKKKQYSKFLGLVHYQGIS